MTEHRIPVTSVIFQFKIAPGGLAKEALDAFPNLRDLYEVEHGDEPDDESFYVFQWCDGHFIDDGDHQIAKVPFLKALQLFGLLAAGVKSTYHEGLTIRLKTTSPEDHRGTRAYWTSTKAMQPFNLITVDDQAIMALESTRAQALRAVLAGSDLQALANALSCLNPR